MPILSCGKWLIILILFIHSAVLWAAFSNDSTNLASLSLYPQSKDYVLAFGIIKGNSSSGYSDKVLTNANEGTLFILVYYTTSSPDKTCPTGYYAIIDYALVNAHAYQSYSTQAMKSALTFKKGPNFYIFSGKLANILYLETSNAWAAVSFTIRCHTCPIPTDAAFGTFYDVSALSSSSCSDKILMHPIAT